MSEANDVVQKEHFAIISKKNSVVPKSKGDNATVMARNNPPSWGLKIPGRPPTPSEGYAQVRANAENCCTLLISITAI